MAKDARGHGSDTRGGAGQRGVKMGGRASDREFKRVMANYQPKGDDQDAMGKASFGVKDNSTPGSDSAAANALHSGNSKSNPVPIHGGSLMPGGGTLSEALSRPIQGTRGSFSAGDPHDQGMLDGQRRNRLRKQGK